MAVICSQIDAPKTHRALSYNYFILNIQKRLFSHLPVLRSAQQFHLQTFLLKLFFTPTDLPNMWLHIPTLAVCFNPRTNWEVSVQQENICIITALHTAVLHSSEQRHSSYGVTGTVTVCGSCCCKCDHSYFNFIALKRQFTKSLTRFSHVGFWAARLHAASAQSAWKDPFIQHILFQALPDCHSVSTGSHPYPGNMWLHSERAFIYYVLY